MKKLFIICILSSLGITAFPQVTAQWRGPDRTGIYPGEGYLKIWPKDGPDLLWSASGIGKGFSSAVADDQGVYVTGMLDSTDYLFAFSKNGDILWKAPVGPAWNGSFPETRGTPTVRENSIFAVSGRGTIACIDRNSGKLRWSVDGYKKFSGRCGQWGVCESPLVVDDKVIYTPAGQQTTMAALSAETGETIWESESLHDTSAYVSPLLINYAGKKIVVTVINKYFIGVDADLGKILWKYDYSSLMPEQSLKIWPGAPKTNTITPLFKDGFVYITGGYNHPGAMFRLSGDASRVDLAWTDTILDCHHGGVVLLNGYIYGSNWIDNSKGNWCCIDWATGKTMYEEPWICKGSIIYSDGMLYCFEEKTGTVGLVKPDPLKFDLVSSFRIKQGKGPFWAHPTIHDGILYIRHGDALMVFSIRNK
jgi:outer membrane protein assembly factor BamB